jgi:hypothetical protein
MIMTLNRFGRREVRLQNGGKRRLERRMQARRKGR